MIDPKSEKDFQDFVDSNGTAPPDELNKRILNFVKAELNPSHKMVFLKLLIIQAFIGFLTLTFCPQFNLSLTNNFELFHYFHHKFGENICMIICGSIFVGSGSLFASHILKSCEIKKINQSKFLYFISISMIALTIFFLLSPEIYLTLAFFWLIGSTVSGIIIFEVNLVIKTKLLNYLR